MLVSPDGRPLDQDEINFRKKALRDTILCIGWLKLMSIMCYIVLFFLVQENSKGHISNVIQLMTLAALPPQILYGILLFMGALSQKVSLLEISICLSIILASFNTVLGVIGGIYFIRTGHLTIHFVLAVIFGLLSLSIFTVLCHDVVIIYAYKQLLQVTATTTTTEQPT